MPYLPFSSNPLDGYSLMDTSVGPRDSPLPYRTTYSAKILEAALDFDDFELDLLLDERFLLPFRRR